MDIRVYMMWVTAGAVLVLLAEVVTGRHKGVYKARGEFPLLGLNMAIGRFLIGPLMAVFVAAVWGFFLPRFAGSLSAMPLWLALPAVLLFAEFCFYWVHRWAHEGVKKRSLLWMIHRTHHSATYMNVSVWMRLNVFWYIIIPNAWTMGLAIYLGLPEAAGIAIVLIAVWNIVTHSNFRWDDTVRRHKVFGPAFRALEHVIVSPGIHHTHHGFGKDGASYRNFGVMLSVWDWVFGTLHIPEGRPWRYGLPGHNAHWLEELAYPLVRIGRPRAD
ncbi:sterol desaturase family protein [Novosphingobium album (ex Hu et al. 2023)]|uniref:Sterol desaturase family protein n=1 Tax=Novosphingobium album (ex Hu et al. 2023) TaxID=2930093 RepID=A0ABT0B3A6_9SPHN|nr:sterol desaturase family protein [Novosphingobium album (ex Hu et al. 2023)]MCJ2179530.1 sterol desaturase family protein [Novosphingobium album (ex Hu et al. 2023)]